MEEIEIIEVEEIRLKSSELIGMARTEDAVFLLKNYLQEKDKELYAQLLLISNRFFDAKQKSLLGLGIKEKIFNRINYDLLTFVNNLEFNFSKKKEEPIFNKKNKKYEVLNTRFLGIILVLIGTFWISNKYLIEPHKNFERNTDVKMGVASTTASLSSNEKKNKKKILLIITEKRGIADTSEYYPTERLRDIKIRIINQYNLSEIEANITNNPDFYEIESEEWVIKRGNSRIKEKDEDLPLRNLILEGLLNENDILSLHHKVEVISEVTPLRGSGGMNTETLLALFSKDGPYDRGLLFSDFTFVQTVSSRSSAFYVGYSMIELKYENFERGFSLFTTANPVNGSFRNLNYTPQINPYSEIRGNGRKKRIQSSITSKFGLKGEDELIIETEIDKEDYLNLDEEE